MSHNTIFQQTSAQEIYLRAVPSTSKALRSWLTEHHPQLSEPIQRRLVLMNGLYGEGEILVGHDFLRAFVKRRQVKGQRPGSVESIIDPMVQALSGTLIQHDREGRKARRILVNPEQARAFRAEVEAFCLAPFQSEAICFVTGESLASKGYGSKLGQAGRKLRAWIDKTYRDHRLHQVLQHINAGQFPPQVLTRFKEVRRTVQQEADRALAEAPNEEQRVQILWRYQRRLAEIDATWCSLQAGPIYLPAPNGYLVRVLVPTPDAWQPEDRRRLLPPEDGYLELTLEGGRLPVLAKLIQEPELDALLDRGTVLEELARTCGDLAPEAIEPGLVALVDGAGEALQAALLSTKSEVRRSTAAFLRQLRSGYQEERYSELVLFEGLEEAEELLDREAQARLQRLRAHPAIAALIAGRKRLEQVVRKAGGLEDAGGKRVALSNPRRLGSLIWTVAISYQRVLLETVYSQSEALSYRVIVDLGDRLVIRMDSPGDRDSLVEKLSGTVRERVTALGLRTGLILA